MVTKFSVQYTKKNKSKRGHTETREKRARVKPVYIKRNKEEENKRVFICVPLHRGEEKRRQIELIRES